MEENKNQNNEEIQAPEELNENTVGEEVPVSEAVSQTEINEQPSEEEQKSEEEPKAEEEAEAPTEEKTAPEYIYSWSAEAAKKESFTANKREKNGKAPLIALLSVLCCLLVVTVVLLSFMIAFYLKPPAGENSGGGSGALEGELLTVTQIAQKCNEYTVAIQTRTVTAGGNLSLGTGSGIILTENGYIATNSHVVSDAESITVHTYNGKTYSGKVIADDPAHDVALIRINPNENEKFTAADIADYGTVAVGERVVAIGTPHSIEYAWTVSVGYVSHLKRSMNTAAGASVKMIQIDVPVNHGNSGGPLINGNGEVIGIVSAKLSDDYEGINFAIPISEYMDFFEDGIDGDMAKPQLGVTGVSVIGGNRYFIDDDAAYTVMSDEDGDYIYVNYLPRYLTEDEQKKVIEVKKSGFLIFGISENSDANGKLRPYDVVIEFDGTELVYDDTHDPYDTVIDILAGKKASDVVKVKYMRDGIEHETSIALKEKE